MYRSLHVTGMFFCSLLQGCAATVGKEFDEQVAHGNSSYTTATISVKSQAQVSFNKFDIERCPTAKIVRLATFPENGTAVVALPAGTRFHFYGEASNVGGPYMPAYSCKLAASFVPHSGNDYLVNFNYTVKDGCELQILMRGKADKLSTNYVVDPTARYFTDAVNWGVWGVADICPR